VKGILAGVAAFLIAFTLQSGVLAANPPQAQYPPQENPDLFQYNGQSLQSYSKDNATLKSTGEWVWRFVDVPGCASESIHSAVSAGFAQYARYGMQIREDPNAGNAHLVYGNCGASFAAICGGPPVIGCLGRGFPYDNTIDISTDMAAYYDVSQRAIANHELAHATFVWNEQYKLNGSFGSSDDVTIMNTGPNSRHDLGPDEDARVWRTDGSPELKQRGYGFNGAWYVWGCNFDANATRLSVLVDYKDGRGIQWAGVIKPVNPDKNGCMGVGAAEGLNIQVGAVYYLKQENPASYLVSKNEVVVP
jgi:hypothetical protein